MTKDYKQIIVNANLSLKQAMKQLDVTREGVVFLVNDNNKLMGSLTGGDIRRWILKGGKLTVKVLEAGNKKPFFVDQKYVLKNLKRKMLATGYVAIPVTNNKQQIVDVLFWSDIFGSHKQKRYKTMRAPVVIMAGGLGKRMEPFTKVLPKPLIPVGDKTIVELIIENFLKHKIMNYFISVNYKSKVIKAYFEDLKPKYQITYIEEKMALGTAGALKNAQRLLRESFFLINCDTIIEENYADMMVLHKNEGNDITVVASLKNYPVPYGVCNVDKKGHLTNIEEKPEYTILANTGMYIIEPDCIKLIPKNTFFHMTDLIKVVTKNGGKVGVYPVKSQAWLDIGEWDEYRKTLDALKI